MLSRRKSFFKFEKIKEIFMMRIMENLLIIFVIKHLFNEIDQSKVFCNIHEK